MQRRICPISWAILAAAASCSAQDFHPDIPKAWDDAEVARFEMPLAQRDRSPRYISADEYIPLAPVQARTSDRRDKSAGLSGRSIRRR